jgi:hypothetical protein
MYLHKPSIPLQAPHRLNARGLFSSTSLSAPFLSRDAQFSHALAGILTCARIHSIELDREYPDRLIHLP